MGTVTPIRVKDDGVDMFCHTCNEPGKIYEGPLFKCSCGWRFLKSRTEHPWDERWGKTYIGLKQYKDKYV